MTQYWNIQQAQAHLADLIQQVQDKHQAQIITQHGQNKVVVIAYEDWLKSQNTTLNLVEFMQQSPLAEIELELPQRDVEQDQHRDIIF